MKRPIARACKEAERLGIIDGLKSIVSGNKIDHIAIMQGNDSANPRIMEGATNNAACIAIIDTYPHLDRPIRRMTPVSKVLVSTEMSSSE